MSKALLVSLANPSSPARDEEFNTWFNEVHGVEALGLPGFRSMTRYKIVDQPVPPGAEPAHRYLAIYEIDDAKRAASALMEAAPGFTMTDAFDPQSAVGLICEQVYTTAKEDRLEQNKAVARRLIEALGRMDGEDFLDCLSDDVIFETPGQFALAGVKTKAEVAAEFPPMNELFPDGIAFTIHTMTAEDDRVHVEMSGKSKTAGGVDYNNRYHYALVIRDGKVKSFRDYLDSDLAMRVFMPIFEKHGVTYADQHEG